MSQRPRRQRQYLQVDTPFPYDDTLTEGEVAALIAWLQPQADHDPDAAATLEWLWRCSVVEAALAIIAHFVCLAIQRIARYSGLLEWRCATPERRADPVAHHRCANAPNAASRPHVLSVAGG